MGGGGFGWDAQERDSESLWWSRPAMAKERERDGFWGLMNLRVSRMTYFPVKPDAPKMIRSKGGGCEEG